MRLFMNRQASRRKFLKDTLRLGILGSLVFIGLELGLRDKESKRTASDCRLKTLCRRCNKWNECNYPKAQAAKDASNHIISTENKLDETRNERK
jgi:hypothetical protein